MHAIVVSVAAAIILSSVAPADARPRARFKSSNPSPVASPAHAAPQPIRPAHGSGGVLPAAIVGGAIGASRGARARGDSSGDTPTGSTIPASDRGTLAPLSPRSTSAAAQPARKARPACAAGATFGGGFCAVN
ncbi:hypothetical protein [Enterovirga rhinocerotis]|uniref:hypothetical protein n=1 Tax=Enterovirga rhinocerotis TaxID=1339210 RepID=UPI00105CE53D|nr:hypothetical protein [Enterovirga rhinocerotis]